MVEGFETYNPAKNWDDFSLGVQTRMIIFNRALFKKTEGAYYLYYYGGLEKGIWESQRVWAGALIKLPFNAHWWEQDKRSGLFSKEFIEVIEAARDTTKVQIFRDTVFEKVPRVQESEEELSE